MATSRRTELVQGTLDMLILRTLSIGPAHGHAIAKAIERGSDNVLRVEHGSLYPALHRLQKRGWINSGWVVVKERNRELKQYRLTPRGLKHLRAEQSTWNQTIAAIARVMRLRPVV